MEGYSATGGRRPKALVIEDAPDICFLLCETLRQSGFDTSGAKSGAEGLEVAAQLQPDLVTLDLTLPDLDGIEVCRRLRAISNAYLIILTARAEETDRLIGLEVGADDYMLKPFSPRELRARVVAMFRRPRLADPGPFAPGAEAAGAADPDADQLCRGDLVLDRESRQVTLAGRAIPLTRTEFDLLAAFMSKPRRVWERDTLARLVWHTDWPGGDHVIDVHVANLRRKLGDNTHEGRWIHTVRGVGYRFGGPGGSEGCG
jgi:DNA-binding response OmpR family regulator